MVVYTQRLIYDSIKIISFINNLNFIKIMDKKELKLYEIPACEVVDLEVEAQLLAGSPNPDDPFDDSKADTEEIE